MRETAQNPNEAADIIDRVMAEMEEVFGLINRPHGRERRPAAAAAPVPDMHAEPQRLAA